MRNCRHARLWRGVKAELEESERQARQQATDKGVPHSASIALPVDLFAALGVEAHRAPTLAGSLGGGVDELWKCNAQPQWQTVAERTTNWEKRRRRLACPRGLCYDGHMADPSRE